MSDVRCPTCDEREDSLRIDVMRAFDRWRSLTPEAQLLTIKSAMAVGVSVIVLRMLGVERSLRAAARPVRERTRTVIGEVVTAVDRAARYVPASTCLSTSLALTWMLRGRGVPAAVRIGVKTAGHFDAHAWVESGGVALNDPERPAERYAAFESL